MKNRLSWFLAFGVLGVCLCLYTQPADAQQPTPGPDQGQQGESNGDNVDTGAAALDSGPEAVEGPETVEGPEAAEASEAAEAPEALTPVTANTTVIPAGVSAATNPGSAQDLDVEGDFDLQEIAGTDTPGPN
jgi:hypothetical protein